MGTRGVAARRGRPGATAAVAVLSLLALGVSASCSTTPPARPTASASATGAPPTATSSSAARPSPTTPAVRTTAPRPRPSPPPTTRKATAGARPGDSCGHRLAAAMTPAQRAGQLLMVGLEPTMSSRRLAAQVRVQGIGGVIYVGGWYGGTGSVATVSARLQAAAAGHLLIAADQEGGAVQQLRGAGFSRMPSARTQATMGTVAEERNARLWSRQLGAAGVNVNLAPVADTVPTWLGAANAPIGRYARDFAPGDPTDQRPVCRRLRPRQPRRRDRPDRQALPRPGPRPGQHRHDEPGHHRHHDLGDRPVPGVLQGAPSPRERRW